MRDSPDIHFQDFATSARTHAFTVDLEDWFHGIPMASADRAMATSRIERGLFPLLDLLDEHGVSATFFILGALADERPRLIKRIVRLGHEIACHGWSHDPIYNMSRERFRAETAQAKDALEQIIGCAVAGYRAPYFSIVSRTKWALDELISAGFDYDSSIFPFRTWRYGMPEFLPRPTRLQTAAGQIIEFPISVQKTLGVTMPVSGGAYFRLYPYAFTAWNFRRAIHSGNPVLFYIHPWELDESHPRIDFDWRARTTHYANLTTTHPKLKRLLSDFNFEPLRSWRRAALPYFAGPVNKSS
jgi:polysaccharide deacetylase family protein (PEP-CTERM system associated)